MSEPTREPRRERQREQKSKKSQGIGTGILAGLTAVIVSLVVLVIVTMNSGDDGEAPPTFFDPTATATTEAPTTEPTQTSTVAPSSPAATATRPPTTTGGFIAINCRDILAPADKQHRMSSDCVPPGLRTVAGSGQQLRGDAADALEKMFADAEKEGLELIAVSGYRSYQTQESTYAYNVATYGQAEADRTSAKPGHSEHQLGTVMDVSTPSIGGELETNFGDTDEGEWVAKNGHKYGFVISYPEGKEAITGYSYEPWHIRWFGPETAGKIMSSGLTIKEYLAR